MNESNIFWLCVVVSVVGILSIAAITVFGFYLFRRSMGWLRPDHPFWHDFFHFLFDKDWVRRNLPRLLSDSYAEFLQRRNELLTTYGQLLLASLVIIVLTILLLTKTISAEAGLPILSGITGFAIGKGVNASRTSSPQNPNE